MRKKLVLFTVLAFAMAALCAPSAFAAKTWKVGNKGDFKTIDAAVKSTKVKPGDTLQLLAGTFTGAAITKKLIIKGASNTKTFIQNGPAVPGTPGKAGLLFYNTSDIINKAGGTQILNIGFKNCDFPVYSGGSKSVGANSITVQGCAMQNPCQGITNWHGNAWKIKGNTINGLKTMIKPGNTLGAGGIGVLIAYDGRWDSFKNEVSANRIRGVLSPDPKDKGGHEASGITLLGDWRKDGGNNYRKLMKDNHVGDKGANSIQISLKAGSKIKAHGIGLTELKDPAFKGANHRIKTNVVKGNTITMSAVYKIRCYPTDLNKYNTVQTKLSEEFDILDSQLPQEDDSEPVLPVEAF